MKRTAVFSLLALAACGDDRPSLPLDAGGDAPAADATVADAFEFPDASPDGPGVVESCTNGIDDDANGAVDCADPVCTAEAHCTIAPHTIQEVQDGTVATGSRVALTKVFVTAARHTAAGSLVAFVQEPDGVTSGAHVYPAYAGIQLFASGRETTAFPALAALQIGDCISISGTIIEFDDDTELLAPTAVTVEPAGTCGTQPSPTVLPIATFATDTDTTTIGDEPGPEAEVYEGVLVRVDQLTAVAPPTNGIFQTTPTGATSPMLLVGSFARSAGMVQATVGQTFTSITGIFAQRKRYQLLPRSDADVISP